MILFFIFLVLYHAFSYELVLVVGTVARSTARILVDKGKLRDLMNVTVSLLEATDLSESQRDVIEFPDTDAPVSYVFRNLKHSTRYIARFYVNESRFEDATFATLKLRSEPKQQFAFFSCSRVNEGTKRKNLSCPYV
jgi:hypothetical protein